MDNTYISIFLNDIMIPTLRPKQDLDTWTAWLTCSGDDNRLSPAFRSKVVSSSLNIDYGHIAVHCGQSFTKGLSMEEGKGRDRNRVRGDIEKGIVWYIVCVFSCVCPHDRVAIVIYLMSIDTWFSFIWIFNACTWDTLQLLRASMG